jgi:glycosyltransferase involved in cell wall biosynthesis
VVATPVGGTPELVVDGETGLLVPPRDPEALAAALQRLLEDPDLARRLGEAGRTRVAERFTAAAQTRRILELYDELTGS